jgi:large subunit ribosomal protein L4
MEVKVYNISGKTTDKTVELSDSVFAIEPSEHSIYLDVKSILANKRQGTHKAKEVSELSGSTRKLYRQKGTGNARRGHIKSPLLRGGARTFGPRVRDYSFKLNKKVKKLARKSALSLKASNSNIFVLEDFNFENIKTKNFAELLTNLNLNNEKVLLILPEPNKNVSVSARNIPNTEVLLFNNFSTYDIMKAKKLVFMESSVKKIEELFN